MFVNVRRCICVDVVYNASYRACKICRCVFNMNWNETCKFLLQTSFREFVVATVATPGTTADLHGSSCVIWASLFPFASEASAALFPVRSQPKVEIWILGRQ